MPTKIWLLDHNYNLWGRAICSLDDPDVRKFSNAIAWHGYAGAADMMSKAHDVYPDAEMYWTEGGPDYTSPTYAADWAVWGKTFTEALRNWCQLRRVGYDPLEDQRDHAQRSVLGFRPLLPDHPP